MLVSLNNMKTYLGIPLIDTSHDVFLTEQLNLFSAAVENYCGRKFELADYVQDYYRSDFYDDHYFYLYHYPTNSIASVKEITTSFGVDSEVTLETYQYRFNDITGKIIRLSEGIPKYWFSCISSNSRIEISYNAGYATIPLEIDSVVKSLVEERYKKNSSGVALGFGSDVQRVSIPGVMSIDFDYSLQPNQRNVQYGMLLGNYVNILDFFRSERPLVGQIKENYVS